MKRRHRSAYGWRAKLGLIVPPTNTVNEPEWQRMAPEGVTIHTARMPLHTDTESDSGRRALRADLARAASDLAQARVDVIAYGCTAGSMVTPPDRLCADITRLAGGTPAVTTAAAIIAALRALNARRISCATPYHDALNAHEARFLAANGIEVLAIRGLGIGADGDYTPIAETPLDTVAAHACAALAPGSDALLITCTDFPTLPLITPLEAELGLPVVTSNTATFWSALRAAALDAPIPACGALHAAPLQSARR